MGGFKSSKHGAARIAVAPPMDVPETVFDTALVERLYGASPLVNDDIRRTLAETYVTVLMQINNLRSRICSGKISVDEARTLPTLVNHLRKTAADLRLMKGKDEQGLMLDPFRTGPAAHDADDEAE